MSFELRKNALRALLVELLQPTMTQFGFHSMKTGGTLFKKKIPDGKLEVAWPMVDRWPIEYTFDLLFRVRLNAVENFAHEMFGIDKKYHSQTNTVSFSLGTLRNNDPDEYSITQDDQVQGIVAQIIPQLEEKAMPLLCSLVTPQAVEQCYNEGKPWDVVKLHRPYKEIRGLLMAWYCHRPDFEELAQKYRATFPEYMLPNLFQTFDDCVEWLRTHTAPPL
jgi:hypothetical protein